MLYIHVSIYNQGLLSRVLGGVPAYPTGCRPFGKVPWTLQSLVLRPLLPRCRLEPKRAGNYTHTASQSDPRVTQMPMGESSKTYGIYNVRATLSHCGRSWTRTCVCVFSGAYFLRFPVTFGAWGVTLVPKMECSFLLYELQVGYFSTRRPQVAIVKSWRGRGYRIWCQMVSQSTKKQFKIEGSGRSI